MYEDKLKALGRLLEVMDTLREKCPWDRVQTFDSLRNNTIEEMYELLDAIEQKDMSEIKKELGDVLLHVVFYSKLGEEQGEFSIENVANELCDKLIYRHPHVYGETTVKNSGEVSSRWEDLKAKEKGRKKGVLSGVPKSLPAVVKAYRLGQKAASAGFDWGQKHEVWQKVKEEIGEIEVEMINGNKEFTQMEFGDLFFSLINAARLYGIDPEAALMSTNNKFISRFNAMEQKVLSQDKIIRDFNPEQLENMWQEVKLKEKENGNN